MSSFQTQPSYGGSDRTPPVSGGREAQSPEGGLEELYLAAVNQPSDISEHVPKLRELASQVQHVTEFGMRHGVSTVALLAGRPKRFVTWDLRRTPIADVLSGVQGDTDFEFRQGDSLTADIEPTDLLFIDTKHTAAQLTGELDRHSGKVRRWIVLHDTGIYGEHGEGGGPGLLPALRQFLHEHSEWRVIYHTDASHGLTVISRDDRDRPQ